MEIALSYYLSGKLDWRAHSSCNPFAQYEGGFRNLISAVKFDSICFVISLNYSFSKFLKALPVLVLLV